MCGCVNRNLGFSASSVKMEEQSALFYGKQGIVSILGSDFEISSRKSSGKSLRRTLSADISSRKWISGNGMEKIPSLGAFAISEINSQSENVEEGGEGADGSRSGLDVWNSIQEQRKFKEEEIDEKGGNFHSWSSILFEKPREDSKKLPPPYVHPLMKRRSNSLSKKSLEICTESLGSETGSDGFSSGDLDDDRSEIVRNNDQDQKEETEIPEEKVMRHEESVKVVKYNCLGNKKLLQRFFPPPIPSLSRQNGVSTHLTTRRDNGRLVLEAFSVVSKNNFCALRQDGRLVLTLTNADNNDGDKEDEIVNQEINKILKEEDEETQESKEMMKKKKMGFVMEQKVPKFTSGLIRFHRLGVVVNKTKMLAYRNPSWPSKFDEIANLKGKIFEEEEEEEKQPNSRSIAPFNGYKNRVFVTATRVLEVNQKQLMLLTRKGANEIVPLMLKGCSKEQNGSFWIWESCSIATS